jgi:hypothetical protein
VTPARILPDLQCSLVCEQVRQEVNRNFFLIGVVDCVVVPQLPIAPVLCVFNRWTAGVGQFTQGVRLVAPDQTTVLRKGELKFAMKDPHFNATTVMMLGPVEFTAPGAYYVEVSVDDVLKVRYPLTVILAQPPPAGPTATASGAQPPAAPQE